VGISIVPPRQVKDSLFQIPCNEFSFLAIDLQICENYFDVEHLLHNIVLIGKKKTMVDSNQFIIFTAQ